MWLFVSLSVCFPTACQQVALPAVPRRCWSFWRRKENTRLCKENLSLLVYVKKGEQHHTASGQPRAFMGTEKEKTTEICRSFQATCLGPNTSLCAKHSEVMQQHWITATEDLALLIQKFRSRQAADLLGRACKEKQTGERKGHRGNYVKKGEVGVVTRY